MDEADLTLKGYWINQAKVDRVSLQSSSGMKTLGAKQMQIIQNPVATNLFLIDTDSLSLLVRY